MNQTDHTNVRDVVKAANLRHIAFIMDGNGRWANSRGLPREAGHKEGAANFKKIMRYCREIGIPCCTVYAFSTENIKRPKHEVNAIFKLFIEYIAQAGDEQDVEFRFIGDPGALSEQIGKMAKKVEEESRGRSYRLNIAMNYGGRAEIVRAAAKLAEAGEAITEESLSDAMDTAGCPDPDLIVRTGNEMRISNFLLWQCAYAELYFTDRLWPDLTTDDVDAAVLDFARRKRRWGGLDSQANEKA